MRLMQYFKGEMPALAVWNEGLGAWIDPCMKELFEKDEEELAGFPIEVEDLLMDEPDGELRRIVEAASNDKAAAPLNVEELIFCPPIFTPSKILCIGLNYADHAKEFNDPIPSEPVVFNKPLSTLIAHGDAIRIPKVSDKIDYEAELVVVIGKTGRDIPESEALDYVFGYTCGNDVSCRDWQKNKPAGQWFLGKSFDTFAPIGPVLVTRDEVPDPNGLAIQSRLNGNVMQSSNTSHFIFPVEKLIAYISQVMTLEPGDLIFTGTPGGVGERRNPPVFLKRGDRIEVEIEKIGTLSNPVVDDRAAEE